ncbi:MAG TPA: ACP S-malonyltransferase, partial [Methylotenera sp.]|nr:ACP S-malonyltransferase [Methylotenera sp.]
MKKFAFFFPGQGSQSVGMKKDFADMSIIHDTFAEGSDILGADFWRMITEHNEDLHITTNTQPLMLIAGIAAWRAWHETGGQNPDVMAGHSLGEYTALVASGVVSFKDVLPLVRYRAEVMQSAVPEG